MLFDTWLLSSIGGLETEVNASDGGWRNVAVRISPAVVTQVRHAPYTKSARFGLVRIDWRFEGDAKRLVTKMEVPMGVTVTLHTHTALELGFQQKRKQKLRLVSLVEKESIRQVWPRMNFSTDIAHTPEMLGADGAVLLMGLGSGRYC